MSLCRVLPGSLRHVLYRGASTTSTIDIREMDTFRDLSKQWADESQAFKALYSLNKVRVPWIKDSISKDKETLIGSRIADIGCGGGLLSIPLARLGADVSGIDANPEAIESARLSLKRSPQLRGSLEYVCTNVTDFAAKNESSFDAVVASEIIEHVADVGSFIDACVRLARPGASIFFTTINKTLMSKLLAVWMAEDVLQIVPEGVHDWNKFMEPELLCQELESRGCEMRFSHGLIYNPMLNEWAWSPSKLMNYAVTAVKI